MGGDHLHESQKKEVKNSLCSDLFHTVLSVAPHRNPKRRELHYNFYHNKVCFLFIVILRFGRAVCEYGSAFFFRKKGVKKFVVIK